MDAVYPWNLVSFARCFTALMLSVSGAQAAVTVHTTVDLANVQFDAQGETVLHTFTNAMSVVYSGDYLTSPTYDDASVTHPDFYLRALASSERLNTTITGTPTPHTLGAYAATSLYLRYTASPLSVTIPYNYSITRQSLDESVRIDLFVNDGMYFNGPTLSLQSIQFEDGALHQEGTGWINIQPFYHNGPGQTRFIVKNYSYAWGPTSAPIPEPETWALMGAGIFAVTAMRRRIKRTS